MHLLNACSIFNIRGVPAEELAEGHPNYKEHRARIGNDKRQKAKQGVHATNYGCKARTLSTHLGSTVHEADRFILAWLAAHPGIKRWQERVERGSFEIRELCQMPMDTSGFISTELTLYSPKHSLGFLSLRLHLPSTGFGEKFGIRSRVYKFFSKSTILWRDIVPLSKGFAGKSAIEAAAREITIPYEDPLCIPFTVKTSTESWGACI